MKRVCVLLAIIAIMSASGAFAAGKVNPKARTIEVADYHVEDGTIHVNFNINNGDVSGTFEWRVIYEIEGAKRSDTSSVTWAKGATSASASLVLGSDVEVRAVRVTKVKKKR